MRDIYITDSHPFYQVWVDGQVYDSFQKTGYPLTWSEQADIVAGYREWFDGED